MANGGITDSRSTTRAYTNAYLEMAFAVLALRVPTVRRYLGEGFPLAAISSSYEGQSLLLQTQGVLDDLDGVEADGRSALRRSFDQINRTSVAAMWDSLTSHRTYARIATEPEIQFLRHIRNACAHDGRFNFTELCHRAKWRDKEILPEMAGTPVFPEFLADGDLILLVVDINNEYFEPVEYPGYVHWNNAP